MKEGDKKKIKLEKQIQKECVSSAKTFGFFAIKQFRPIGIPDFLFLKKDEFFFVEFKSQKGKLTKTQSIFIENLKKKQIKVFVIRSKDEMEKLLKKMK